MVIVNGYKWILLRHEGYITGLYHEHVRSGVAIMRLGVIGEGTSSGAAPLPPQYHNCRFPSPPIGAPNAGLFLSFAVLHRKTSKCPRGEYDETKRVIIAQLAKVADLASKAWAPTTTVLNGRSFSRTTRPSKGQAFHEAPDITETYCTPARLAPYSMSDNRSSPVNAPLTSR